MQVEPWYLKHTCIPRLRLPHRPDRDRDGTDRPSDRQTDRPTDRQTDRQTADRQTKRQTDRQTDRQTNKQADRETNYFVGECSVMKGLFSNARPAR